MTPKQARDVLRSSNLTGTSLLALLDQIAPIVVTHEQASTQTSQASSPTTGWDSIPVHQLESRATMLRDRPSYAQVTSPVGHQAHPTEA